MGVKSHGDLKDLEFSPDGNSVATAGWDGQVKIWQVPSEIEQPQDHNKYFCDHGVSLKRVHFSPDGTLLATVSSDDGMVKVWNMSSGQKPLWVGKDMGLEMAFSPDGKLLALANKYDHVVHVLDISTGKYEAKARLPGHTNTISHLAFLPDAKSPERRFLLTASEDGTVKMWDVAGSKELFSLAGHQKPVKGLAVIPDFDKKGKHLVSVGSDGQARVWDIAAGHTSAVNKVTLSQDGARLASVSNDGTARMYDTQDGIKRPEGPCAGPVKPPE